jgi:hypothetical protein
MPNSQSRKIKKQRYKQNKKAKNTEWSEEMRTDPNLRAQYLNHHIQRLLGGGELRYMTLADGKVAIMKPHIYDQLVST